MTGAAAAGSSAVVADLHGSRNGRTRYRSHGDGADGAGRRRCVCVSTTFRLRGHGRFIDAASNYSRSSLRPSRSTARQSRFSCSHIATSRRGRCLCSLPPLWLLSVGSCCIRRSASLRRISNRLMRSSRQRTCRLQKASLRPSTPETATRRATRQLSRRMPATSRPAWPLSQTSKSSPTCVDSSTTSGRSVCPRGSSRSLER